MQKKFLLLLFSGLLIQSCVENSMPISLGLDYFPINRGEYRTYDVIETSYVDKIESVDKYQLRESFYDSIESEDEVTFLMRIERRNTDVDNWKSIEIIAIRQTNSNLEYQENNTSLVKMSYPVQVDRTWDGNAQNENSEQLYRYEQLGESDFTFENSDHIKMIISDLPGNIVEQDERFEIYALGIGLVERNFIEINFCQSSCDNAVNLRENGRILSQRLIEYGIE